ncbi:MAG TPA: SMI1/KNR4 family protein [Acidobacteriaceae bacterium]|nr:SMI1/KNR4 family protein [Acidobacteriaceae bacterium]
MSDFLDDLTAFWKTKRVDTATHKATEIEIEAWERRYNVVLPADLRRYVTRVNGVHGGENLDFDHEGITFLPLSAMCPEAEWTEVGGRSGMFVFADFLVRCNWWCVQLDSNPHEHTRIFFGGGLNGNRLLATSLSEFFDLYRNHHMRLHGQ